MCLQRCQTSQLEEREDLRLTMLKSTYVLMWDYTGMNTSMLVRNMSDRLFI